MRNNDRHQSRALEQASYWLVKMQSPSFSSDDEKTFFQWLSESPDNQSAYVKAEQTWERGSVLDQVSVKNTQKTNWFGLANGGAWQTAVFASVLCVALFFGFQHYYDPTPQFVEYKTQRGEQREIVLKDGSTMLLNTESVARVGYSRSKRMVLLDTGEAFFSVKNNPKKPFDVITSSGRVRVLGTQFSVHSLTDATTVTVLEGRVGLSSQKQNEDILDFTAEKVLSANQQIRMEDLHKNLDAESVDASASLAWRAKRIVARGQSLAQVVDDINRYYKTEIRIEDPAVAQKNISAVITLGDFDQTVTTLTQSLSLKSKALKSESTLNEDVILLY